MKVVKLTENALFLALAIALSFVKIYEMPMGGSITLCSMLPIMFSGIKYGKKTGLMVAFMFSLYQLLSAVISGNVFVWCNTSATVILVTVFDYILPFTVLGLAGFLNKISIYGYKNFGLYLGISFCIFFRFICHFITGVKIWGQWANGMNVYTYSLLYNISYLLPELLITLVVSVILFRLPVFKINTKN